MKKPCGSPQKGSKPVNKQVMFHAAKPEPKAAINRKSDGNKGMGKGLK